MNQMSRPTNSSVGPKPTSSSATAAAPASGGLALTGTPLSPAACANSSSSPKDGRWVVKRSTCSALPSFGGYSACFLNWPSIVSPVEVISVTLPACTWVEEERVRHGRAGRGASSIEEMIQLTIRASRISHQVRRSTRPQLGLLASEPPVPGGGAPSTFHGGRSVDPSRSAGRSLGRGGSPAGAAPRSPDRRSPAPRSRSLAPPRVPVPSSPYKCPNVPARAGVPTKRPWTWDSRTDTQPAHSRTGERVPCWGGERCGCWWSRTRCGWPPALQRGLQAEGFTVDLAHDGEDGLHLAREGSYDAIVLDIMLPGLSGYRVVRAAARRAELGAGADADRQGRRVRRGRRARPRRRRLPDQAVLVRRAGGPAAGAAAPRRAGRGRPCWRPATCRSTRPRRRCAAAATEIELTPREFSLLEFLMRRRRRGGQPRPTSCDHVWDANYDGDANVVEVYVGYLRRKIDAPFGRRRGADRARRGLPAGRRRWLTHGRRVTRAAGRPAAAAVEPAAPG